MVPTAEVTASPDDDSELMQRVQAGDEIALGVLMHRWERPVKSVIARLIFNARETEDLAQETFVRVWQQRMKFTPTAPFRPWVFAIAVNLARNRLRWWRSRPEIAIEEWTETPDDIRGGLGVVERSERALAVREALAALPVDLREVIVLSEYEHLSQSQIAGVVGATRKAVENRVARARDRLRSSLKGLV